jgi:hypothetical protein
VVFAIEKDVARAVVRPRRERHFKAGRHTDHDVAHTRAQRVAKEPAPLRPPGVFDSLAHLPGQQFGDLVFKTLAGLIRKWKVVWIGANA